MQVWTMVWGQTVFDGVGQALQAVADEHQHVLDAAVLDLGEDLQPVLRALTAVAGPEAEDVPVPLDRDRRERRRSAGSRPVRHGP